MLLSMLRAKLHSATVTECDLHYEGSCAIDRDLLNASGLLVNEEIHIWNVNSGARIVTYVIPAERGSGAIAVNGAAARHFSLGDKVIIAGFAQIERDKANDHKPTVVILGEGNRVETIKS